MINPTATPDETIQLQGIPGNREYPIGIYVDEVVVWQSGQFREVRALAGLRRIANFDPSAKELGPFGRTRQELVQIARDAIASMEAKA